MIQRLYTRMDKATKTTKSKRSMEEEEKEHEQYTRQNLKNEGIQIEEAAEDETIFIHFANKGASITKRAHNQTNYYSELRKTFSWPHTNQDSRSRWLVTRANQ